ncbi:MAG: NAD(P)H-dependent glycerol-3-phosphate dehydrogenase [Rickettsiales bacterium]|jgi:glycerol-3-phosphate dehydrogenase (NAD(P)+)|nr:NAD(P)H-dependent glycerol-3-phosphate dehydrogenase [Rickettsiales bacterium]
MQKIGVIGGGAWGTAIANLLSHNGNIVKLWVFEEDTAKTINAKHLNENFLPDITLHSNLSASTDLTSFTDKDILFLVIPAQFTASTIKPLQNILPKETILVICSKGIETSSKKLLTDIISEIFPENKIAAMSGPNFADEVAKLKPAITTVASDDKETADKVAKVLENDDFKVYTHSDIIGVELAGALKNVVAIASGIATGLNLSVSTKCAILTKGIHEMAKISEALGGKRETMLEACGIGDLTLTCMSEKSRNMSLGIAIGRGQKLSEILSKRKTVAEGVATSKALYEIINQYDLNCYLFTLIYQILFEDLPLEQVKFI